ncbi:MAG TPA: hypothetical protein DEB70_04035 [Planctomycetaceae bacterium]|nr:hypothetical protein [Planctomycetaceae bacterium]
MILEDWSEGFRWYWNDLESCQPLFEKVWFLMMKVFGAKCMRKKFLSRKFSFENSVPVRLEAFMADNGAITPRYQKKGPRKGLGPRGAENLSHFRERLVL